MVYSTVSPRFRPELSSGSSDAVERFTAFFARAMTDAYVNSAGAERRGGVYLAPEVVFLDDLKRPGVCFQDIGLAVFVCREEVIAGDCRRGRKGSGDAPFPHGGAVAGFPAVGNTRVRDGVEIAIADDHRRHVNPNSVLPRHFSGTICLYRLDVIAWIAATRKDQAVMGDRGRDALRGGPFYFPDFFACERLERGNEITTEDYKLLAPGHLVDDR